MNNIAAAHLAFNPELNQPGKKELNKGLSAIVKVDNTLWVANDETTSLERLSFQGKDSQGIYQYGDHKQFQLGAFIWLPVPPSAVPEDPKESDEADVEGMDIEDGYLWLVGSHSLKRGKVKKKQPADVQRKTLSDVSSDGNRYLLARIPLVKKDNTWTLEKKCGEKGRDRTATRLHGNKKGNGLIDELRDDRHLKMFFDIPGKDNGFDIEGLAVSGDRVFIGLRGPVLRGWAVVLELELEEVDHGHSPELKLKNTRKHFLGLGGLGVRDLCVHGSDLLIMAGPTMELDGPVTVFRWKEGTRHKGENFISNDELIRVLDIPYGQGDDHAEGMTLFSSGDGEPDSLLVVYDSASKSRLSETSGVKADIFPL